jgi:hypothetical protein
VVNHFLEISESTDKKKKMKEKRERTGLYLEEGTNSILLYLVLQGESVEILLREKCVVMGCSWAQNQMVGLPVFHDMWAGLALRNVNSRRLSRRTANDWRSEDVLKPRGSVGLWYLRNPTSPMDLC